jgi:hypothetical protein
MDVEGEKVEIQQIGMPFRDECRELMYNSLTFM